LTLKLNEELKFNNYELICDIIKTRSPKTINVEWDKNTSHEPVELKNVSEIVGAIKEKIRIKVYASCEEIESKSEKLITQHVSNLINGWS
jgi:hypothetical protein